MKRTILVTVFCFLCSMSILAQTTAFTYQGSLKDGSIPANGNFDFEFKLFDALSAGTQQGSAQQRLNVAVANGVFAVSLDFGAGTLPGANRYLEIAVRTAGGGTFTTLAPRQQVNSAPYSVKSLNSTTADLAINAAQLGGVAANQYVTTSNGGSNFVQNTTTQQSANFNINGNGVVGGSLGIGIANPIGSLHINVPGSGTPIGALTLDVGTFGTGANAINSYFFKVRDLGLGGTPAFLIRGDGNVGINTIAPAGKMQVVTSNDTTPTTITAWDSRHFVIGGTASTGGIGMSYDQTNNTGFIHSLSPNVQWRNLVLQAGGGNVGINTSTPAARLDVNGGLALNGAVSLGGNQGQAGQVITSNGTNPAQWKSSTDSLYQGTTMNNDTDSITPSTISPIPGLSRTVNVSGNSKLLIQFSVLANALSCSFCGSSTANINIGVDGFGANYITHDITNGAFAYISGSWLVSVGAGNHTIVILAGSSGPIVRFGCPGGCLGKSTLIVQVIPE